MNNGCGKFLACSGALDNERPIHQKNYRLKKRLVFDYQSLDSRRSAPGAADPKNLDDEDDAVFGRESTRCAFKVLMAISSFLRGPKAVILSSVRFSGVSERNISMSISFTTKVPIKFIRKYKSKTIILYDETY